MIRAEHLARALLPGGGRAPRIAVLGAGMSGLVAACELHKAGLPVEVFERSGRVGGRVETFRFPGTRHMGELGAMRIPGSHVHTLRYISELGLEDRLSRFTTLFQNRSCVISPSALASLPSRLGDEGAAANSLVDLLVRSVLCKLAVVIDTISPGEIREVFHHYMSSALYRDLSALISSSVEPSRSWFILNATIEELVDFFSGLEARMAASLRLFFRDITLEVSKDLFFLRGGLQQLPERLARSMPGSLRMSCEVKSLHNHEDRVELVVHDRTLGRSRRETFDYVLCTLPVPVLRTISLVGLGARKMEAMKRARYASASKVLLLCRRAFWRASPYGIRAGAASVDDFVRQMYYTDLGTDEESAGVGEGVLLASYSLGRDSEGMATWSDDELVSSIMRHIGRIHPEICEPGMVMAYKVRHWQKEEGFLGGCSVSWPIYYAGAGSEQEVDRIWEEIAAPDGRVFFAGEHCSSKRAWIEGAVESGLRAVSSLLTSARVQRAAGY